MLKKVFISILLIITLLLASSSIFASNNNTELSDAEYNTRIMMSNFLRYFFQGKELFNANRNIDPEIKQKTNILIIVAIPCLLTYWIILFWKYDKEDECDISYYIEEEELFKKYNPLLAGCFLQERIVMSRDLIAVILNLVNKGIIELEVLQDKESKTQYRYMLKRVKEQEIKMDLVERYVHSWFFDIIYDRDNRIDLGQKLKEISNSKNSIKKMQELNKIAKKELNKKGANLNKTPNSLKAINFFILFATIFLITMHIYTNGLAITIYESAFLILGTILFVLILIIPLVATIIQICINLMLYGRQILKEKIRTKTIYVTIVSIIFIFSIIIILIAIFAQSKYLIIDMILLAIAILIVRTDNLMLKNDTKVLQDYYSLKALEDKIQNYSLLEEKNIEHIKIWNQYLTYAISFGIPEKITKQIKKIYPDDVLLQELNNNGFDCIYYISKAYLEIMWEMEFPPEDKKEQ